MGRPKSIYPCKMKGRYGGKTGDSGRTLRKPPEAYYSGCECRYAFHSILRPAKITYDMVLDGSLKGSCLRKSTVERSHGIFSVVPCKKHFLKSISLGTVLHKNNFGNKTKFSGCENIERALVDNKEVSYFLVESLNHQNLFNAATVLPDDPFEAPSPMGFITSDIEKHKYLMLAADAEQRHDTAISNEYPVYQSSDSPLADLFSHYNAMIDKKKAYIKPVWKKLTKDQRKAVTLVFIENDDGLTKVQIAKKLGIGVKALNERLNWAIKKIAKHYNNVEKLEKIKKALHSTNMKKLEFKDSDTQHMGFYRKSNDVVNPVYKINPNTGRRIIIKPKDFPKPHKRKGVDKEKIKAWIRATSPIPYNYNSDSFQ